MNWKIGEKGQALIAFVRRLTELRHGHEILRRNRFLRGQYNEKLGVKDVTWINALGEEMQEEQCALHASPEVRAALADRTG